MKLTFRGWKREVTPHSHKVAPVEHKVGRYYAQQIDQPITWNGPLSALGKINSLGLSGNFLVEFSFEREELKSWLEQYAQSNPEDTLRLLAPIAAEATIRVAKQAQAGSPSALTPE